MRANSSGSSHSQRQIAAALEAFPMTALARTHHFAQITKLMEWLLNFHL